MADSLDRKERLHRLIDFARVYRGWSRQEMAQALSRDSTKLYPNTDNPKLDLLLALASALDWGVDDVVGYIWSGERLTEASPTNGETFSLLDAQARQAHVEGRFADMVKLARRMYELAETPEERARACNREHGAWDGLGQYTNALSAACRGLQQAPIPPERQYQLQANLANTHYCLWELTAALAHSHLVVEWYEAHVPEKPIERKTHAFAYYVRGNTRRRQAGQRRDASAIYQQAAADLAHCAALHERLADELKDERLRAIGHTCRGALLEVAVELGQRDPHEATREVLAELDSVVDPATALAGDELESFGWWCIFGANIALRWLHGRELQQSMAIFTNKALEIAERLNNWALRERVFSMQYKLHEALADTTGLDLPYVVDDEDRRLITGAMGRFPIFRETGWRIFRAAKVIRGDDRN